MVFHNEERAEINDAINQLEIETLALPKKGKTTNN